MVNIRHQACACTCTYSEHFGLKPCVRYLHARPPTLHQHMCFASLKSYLLHLKSLAHGNEVVPCFAFARAAPDHRCLRDTSQRMDMPPDVIWAPNDLMDKKVSTRCHAAPTAGPGGASVRRTRHAIRSHPLADGAGGCTMRTRSGGRPATICARCLSSLPRHYMAGAAGGSWPGPLAMIVHVWGIREAEVARPSPCVFMPAIERTLHGLAYLVMCIFLLFDARFQVPKCVKRSK